MLLHILIAIVVFLSLLVIGFTIVGFLVKLIVEMVVGVIQWTERVRRDA